MNRFRVALSFAGHLRPTVDKVAQILEIRYSKEEVLYDQFHEAEFARDRLDVYLPKLYFEETDLIVVFLSEEYEERDWCGLEWDAIRAKMKTDPDKVLLCAENQDDGAPGLYGKGFIQTKNRSAIEIAKIVKLRHSLASISAPADQTSNDESFALEEIGFPAAESQVVRTEELQQVLDALQPRARPWGVLLSGESGFGKTTLATKAARTQQYFEKAIYVTAKVTDGASEPLASTGFTGFYRIFDDLLAKLDAENASRLPPEERVSLASQLLATQRALLVFDNLEFLNDLEIERLDNVLHFLPFGCKAIAVSNKHVALAGSEKIDLQKLEDPQSRDLINGMFEGSKSDIAVKATDMLDLMRMGGGNPTLLKLLVAKYLDEQEENGGDNWEHEQDVLGLSGHFESVAASLSDDERLLLTMMAVIGEPFGSNELLELAGDPRDRYELALSGLSKKQLLVVDAQRLRCYLPGSIAEFVRQNLSGVLEETAERLTQFAESIILEHADDFYGLNHELEVYWPVISSVWHHLCELPSRRLQALCVASKNFLNFTGKWDARIKICSAAEVRANEKTDYLAAGRRAYDVAMVHYRRGDYTLALEISDRIEEYYADLSEGQGGIALAHRVRGLAFRGLGQFENAIHFGQLSVDGFSNEKENRDLACAVNALAATQAEAGELEEAKANFESAIEIARRIGAKDYEADYRGNLADVPILVGDWKRADEIVSDAMPLSQALGRRELVARNYLRKAKISLGRNEALDALDNALNAQRIFDSIEMPQAAQAKELAVLAAAT